MTNTRESEAKTFEGDPTVLLRVEHFANAHNSLSKLLTKETNAHTEKTSAPQIIRLSQLTQMLSISRSCVYDWLNPKSPRHDPSFPKQVRLSGRKSGGAVGWRLESVIAWLNNRDQSDI
ncbi:TPA: helix-turn-helix transcriptional regulator [Pseudomonas aeruginosa]|nr:AlpA family phage regulatory protein [Pseudomonas aeruginosa]MBG4913548.1 AlpA family phage regulatory protein [Pseudomonas aeruginosa]MBG4925227.1 AlpA family phage regulatory protein [Pseudomonas aeruginosa]MBG5555898.1 AlpA family phage regulatory protein [Pseudomonas aeruginosa]MBG5569869.1 AlpA family phage regulatory protein [Pseudomonas aeruginosa]